MTEVNDKDDSIFSSLDDGELISRLSKERQKEILKQTQDLKKAYLITKEKLDSLDESWDISYIWLLNVLVVFMHAVMAVSWKFDPNTFRLLLTIFNAILASVHFRNLPKNTYLSLKRKHLNSELQEIDSDLNLQKDFKNIIKVLKNTKFSNEYAIDIFINDEVNEEKYESLLVDLEEHAKLDLENTQTLQWIDRIFAMATEGLDITDHDKEIILWILTDWVKEMSNFDSWRHAKELMRIETDDHLRREIDEELPDPYAHMMNTFQLSKDLEMRIDEIIRSYTATLDLESLTTKEKVKLMETLRENSKWRV